MPLHWLVETLIEALLPADCPVCRDALPARSPGGVCASCWERLPPLPPGLCARCADRCEPAEGGIGSCEACTNAPPPFRSTLCVAPFEGTARDILHTFKFDDRPELARPLGARLGEELRASPHAHHLVVSVPQRLWKRRRRGYDPAALLARIAARRAGLQYARSALRKVRRTRDQASLESSVDRLVNLRGAFRVSRRSRNRVAGRNILLVDDILTTGATASECARALRDAGAARVDLAVFARTLRRSKR
jgi:ComF family protein